MEFLNNLKFITVLALSLAMSAGLVNTNTNSNHHMMDYVAY